MKQKLIERLKTVSVGGLLVKLALLWFIVTFLIFPNLSLLINVFIKNGQFSTEVFGKILSSERAVKSLKNSFILAFSLIVTVNIVGTLLVLFTDYFEIKGAKLLKVGYMSTLVYGGIVLCTGYKFIYGAKGIFTKLLLTVMPNLNPNWFSGYFAVLYIMTFACTSNHIIFLSNAIRGIDYFTVEAAKNLGASAPRIFFKVVMPVLRPTLFAITILTFLSGLGAMSAPLVVGGENFQTINPMIITFAKNPYSREIAALLAIILGIATIILLTVMNKIEKGGKYISISKTKNRIQKQKITNPFWNALAHIGAYGLFLIYVVPILLVVLYSFTDSTAIMTSNFSFSALTMENYKSLFIYPASFKPYLVSILYSITAAVIVAVIVVIVSRIIHRSKSRFDMLFEYCMLIPWLLPSTLVALGLMMTYDKSSILVGNRVLIGTTGILLFGYIIIKLPFAFRMIKAAFFSVESSLEEAARCMGAGTFYTMRRVIVPVILPVVLSVIVLTFNSLLAEYDLTVFLYHPLLPTLGVEMKAASEDMASLNSVAMSFVYAVVLIVLSSLALYFTRTREK